MFALIRNFALPVLDFPASNSMKTSDGKCQCCASGASILQYSTVLWHYSLCVLLLSFHPWSAKGLIYQA
jgi:hypothetical protein